MKNNIGKKIFTGLLSLTFLLSANNSLIKASSIDIKETQLNYIIKCDSTGKNEGDEVSAYLSFMLESPLQTGDVGICSVSMRGTVSGPLQYQEFIGETLDLQTSHIDTDANGVTIGWSNIIKDVEIPVNTEVKLGTIKFNLTRNLEDNEPLYFTLKSGENTYAQNYDGEKSNGVSQDVTVEVDLENQHEHDFTYTPIDDKQCVGECSVCHETITDNHTYEETVFSSTSTNLGGTEHKCSKCGYVYWNNFTKDDKYAQTLMPNDETVYHYCTHNGLATETTVDIGDQSIRVFLQDPLGILKKNEDDVLGIVVTYVEEGSDRYNELLSKIDGDFDIEHIKFFEVYPTVNGIPVTGALDGSVYMEYEIPEGWDESDLEMILVRDGEDQEFDEAVLDIDGNRYLAMWKNHFSPYAMIDKMSEKEKSEAEALETLGTKDLETEALESEQRKDSDGVKTGDESGYAIFAVSSLLIIAGLYLELYKKQRRNN